MWYYTAGSGERGEGGVLECCAVRGRLDALLFMTSPWSLWQHGVTGVTRVTGLPVPFFDNTCPTLSGRWVSEKCD